jgi:hypothetical protein
VTVLDPGRRYALKNLNGEGAQHIRFVKREGVGYSGNIGAYPGTNLQECWRAEIDRLKYLNNQEPCEETEFCINRLRECIQRLELRAARRHGRHIILDLYGIEDLPTCGRCGHIGCEGTCVEIEEGVKP